MSDRKRQIIRVIVSEYHNRLNSKMLKTVRTAKRTLLDFFEIKILSD